MTAGESADPDDWEDPFALDWPVKNEDAAGDTDGEQTESLLSYSVQHSNPSDVLSVGSVSPPDPGPWPDAEARIVAEYSHGAPDPIKAPTHPHAVAALAAMKKAPRGERAEALDQYLSGLPPREADSARRAIQSADQHLRAGDDLVAVGAGDDDWGEPTDLPSDSAVPVLTPDMLPDGIRQWLVDAADHASLPLEYVAAPVLAAAGSLLGRKVGVKPSPYNEYVVTPNLWCVIVGPPGSMKSEALGIALAPLRALAEAAAREYKEGGALRHAQSERFKEEKEVLQARIRQAFKKGEPTNPLVDELTRKHQEEMESIIPPRRYETSDSTVEKLGEILHDNPRGILLFSDELTGWVRKFERPGREGDKQFFLQAWEGRQPFTVDRIGRGTVRIEAPTISVVSGIQPGPLRSLAHDAIAGGPAADGLLQRLQLLVWPEVLPPYKRPTRLSDQRAIEAARALFEWIDTVQADDLGAEQKDGSIPFVSFAPDAQDALDEWWEGLEKRLRGGELEDTPAFASHLSKYRSLLPSLAFIFQVLDRGRGPIQRRYVDLALKWVAFLEAHARRLYAPEIAPDTSSADALLKQIRAGKVLDGDTVRAVEQHHWKGLGHAELEDGLATLERHGWVRVVTRETGGRPSPIVRLHPQLRRDEPT